jgi:hypothetical protein
MLVIGQEVHDRHQKQAHRLAEIDQLTDFRVLQDRFGFPQVGQNDSGGAAAGQQGAGMRMHDGVVVHVDDTGPGRDLVGDLMHVASGRDSRADIDELPYPRLTRQEPHYSLEKRPVRPGCVPQFRCSAQHSADRFPVGGIVVLTTQVCVVHPGRVWPARIELRGGETVLHRILPIRIT